MPHVTRDGIAEVVTFLGLVTSSLAEIATDVMLMMATELGEVSEPFIPGRGASSTMPQKRNPISSELILAAAKSVLTASAFANARYMLDGAGGSRRADARQSGPHQWPDRGGSRNAGGRPQARPPACA